MPNVICLGEPLIEFRAGELRRIVRRANAVGAPACTKVGATASLPTAGEVEQFLAGR